MMKFKLKFADVIVVGTIIFFGISGLWSNLQPENRTERKYAEVYIENSLRAELSLAPGESYNHRFEFGEDNQNEAVVEVDDGRIRMLPMGEDLCPKGICSHTGWISQPYESIVCLPNQIMIVFSESAADDEKLDGVTF